MVLVHNRKCGNAGGLNSVDDIVTQGQKAFDNFNIDSAEAVLRDALKNEGNGSNR